MSVPDPNMACRKCEYPVYVEGLVARLRAAEQVVEAARYAVKEEFMGQPAARIINEALAEFDAAVGGNTP